MRAASSLLRHYLEYLSAELCHRLRAPVQFRGDAQYELGELLPSATGRMKKLFGQAKNAANSWNQQEVVAQLADRENEFARLVSDSNAEKWQVNAAIHFNSWENLSKEDFRPVVESYKNLLAGFTCTNCSEFLRVLPDRESAQEVRCECGRMNMNLLGKSEATARA